MTLRTPTFAGWTPEVAEVTGDATYTATFEANVRSYTITWTNDDDSVIDTTTVAYGVVPTHADPEKAPDAEFTYEFAGWTPEVAAVTGDATYKATFEATPLPVVEDGYNVTLVVTGSGGYASLNGTETSASYTELIPAGELANISVRSEGSQFIGLFYSQPGAVGTSIRFSPSLESFRVGSNITVEARFSGLSTSDELHQVTLLTDSNLSYSQIASNAFPYGEFDAYGFAGFDPDEDYPVAKGLEFVGWSLDEDPANAVEDLDDLAGMIDEIEEDVIVYAVYTGDDELVTIDQDVAAALKSAEYDAESGRVYFTVDYLVPEGYRGIQAGIIATKNASLATDDKMNLDLIGTTGVVVSRADTFYDGDGYLLPAFEFALGVRSASGTIYGRGYIVLQNIETGEVTTIYTDEIGSGTIGG